MTFEIALALGVLAGALLLLVTEWVRADLVALMVLSALALSGLVSPGDALAGFSNPAVVTVWAMFILSEGMTRAGIADIVGRAILRAGGRGEARVIAIVMLTGGVLSGFMNNIGVAALMLPITVGIAQRTGLAPSRLLMPLAYGTLLGGLTTLIGTPPNLLASAALRDAELRPFALFDFTPLGAPILLAGTAFVALVGRHLLPDTDPLARSRGGRDLRAQYGLQERIFAVRVPPGSLLAGRTIAAAGLSSVAGLIVIALTRGADTQALPAHATELRAGDLLLVQGRRDRFETLRAWSGLVIERETPVLRALLSERTHLREVRVAEASRLAGGSLRHRRFRETHAANVLALRRDGRVRRTRLAEVRLAAGDRLLVQCAGDALQALERSPDFDAVVEVEAGDLERTWHLQERLFAARVPRDAPLAGVTLGESRLGDAFDFRVLAILSGGELAAMPPSDAVLRGGDVLLIQGREEDLDVLRGLQQLEIERDATPHLEIFELGELEMIEVALHPHATLAGKTIAELDLRERQRVEVVALWRGGQPHRSGLDAMTLQPGDALLLVGPRERLAALNDDPNLIVLTPVSARVIDTRKTPLAAGLMLAVVGSVLLGGLPIAIAAVTGATLMVLTRCLSMEQAYRAIDWRSIFLIAGMLPLGVAMQETGAAELLAGAALAALSGYGPWAAIAGLYGVTALATVIVPPVVVVVLMAPIALSASAALDVSPHALVMVTAVAAAASFTSPVSHPANVLVRGPGGYRFVDYLKLGVPLTLVAFAVTALLLPLVWPLR
jgi:di/tricarboxylate transporter